MNIAALDPGRDKCGLAVLDETGKVLIRQVIETARLEQMVAEWHKAYGFFCLVEGNGTTSGQARSRLKQALPSLDIRVVDEYRTTEMARGEYWKVNPPTGWRRLLPPSLQVPPEPVDDLVAVILGRRYLKDKEDVKNGR